MVEEITLLEDLRREFPENVTWVDLVIVKKKNYSANVTALIIGPDDKTLPCFAIFAGIHGLEKIGSSVALNFLSSLLQQLQWNEDLQLFFKKNRLVAIPIVNPIGVIEGTRCNGNGVDLMRNAPINSVEKVFPLVGGHRYSNMMPWYRGLEGTIEKESKAVIDFVREELFPSRCAISIDIHSGFGMRDRVWYPYAKTVKPFGNLKDVLALEKLLSKTFPTHVYKVESQAASYMTHGDLWDYLYDLHREEVKLDNLYLPLTLEMGSWMWLKKNPIQIFSLHGLFHPIKNHRRSRIMRRHVMLLDFLQKATANYKSWRPHE